MLDADQPRPEGFGSTDGGVSEWRLRVQLANAYRIVARLGAADYGWTLGVYNHITVRLAEESCSALGVPGPLFLINPIGCRFDEVTPGCLHTIDLEGEIVRRGCGMPGVPDKGVLIAGFVIHSAIHAARHDVAAIFHTHHPDVVAVSALKCGLLPVSQEGCLALAVHSQARHAFEGTATDPAERVRLAENLGAAAYTLTLDNHGVICCGRSIPEALRHLWVFTKACTYQVRALAAAGGDPDRLVLPPREVVERAMERELKQQAALGPSGELEFAAWMRGAAC